MQADKIAWITGAGTGMGRELARRLAQEGWLVAISARTAGDLDSLALEMPGRLHAFPLDVTDAQAVAAVVAGIGQSLGGLDLVVLNAGTYEPISAKGFDLAAFGATIEVNLMGTVNCLAAVMPQMIERGGGEIAIVASIAGFVGLPGASAYGASKAALNNLAEALQPDLARHGVMLRIVNPGFVDTPLTRKNDFPMPFLMPVDKAVDRIMAGLKTRRFEIVFPWQMGIGMKALRLLPHRLLFAITRYMLR